MSFKEADINKETRLQILDIQRKVLTLEDNSDMEGKTILVSLEDISAFLGIAMLFTASDVVRDSISLEDFTKIISIYDKIITAMVDEVEKENV